MSFPGSRTLCVAFLQRAAAWPFRVAAARATLRMLASMDCRELADIGLSRSDLRDVSALALDCDPTKLLARRAAERRRDAHAPPTARPVAAWGGAPDRPAFRPGAWRRSGALSKQA